MRKASTEQITVPSNTYISTDEFRQRMGWKTITSVYLALKDNRVPGAIMVSGVWLIPHNAIAIDRRRFKPVPNPNNGYVRQYIYVNDGISVWLQDGYVWYYDGLQLLKEKDSQHIREKYVYMAKGENYE